jgi:hypothetical protein
MKNTPPPPDSAGASDVEQELRESFDSQLLSDDNINANLKTNKGKKTPLELAIFWNYHEDHRECVKILQDYGAPDYEPPARCCGRAEMDQSLLE